MHWSELLEPFEVVARGGEGDPEIRDVVYDSRKATPGAAFVAVHGVRRDGGRFVADALERGAAAVVAEDVPLDCPVPWVQVADARASLGLLGTRLWHVDLAPVVMVGVTGTNGKTTTATLAHALLERRFGSRAWLFGSIEYSSDGRRVPAPLTTPESVDVLRAIGTAAERPAALAMEVSSHSLELRRVAGLSYDVGVFTNLTQDHLDFHPDMEAYFEAKKKLFTRHLKRTGTAVVNLDDPWGRRLTAELEAPTVTFGRDPAAAVRITRFATSWDGSELELAIDGRPETFTTRLVGSFNAANVTGLVATARALGSDLAEVRATLAGVAAVRGRMERVPLAADFAVVVDYAHTPDALEKVLAAARPLTDGRLLCVFGCGGDRDRGKRPLMAQAVARGADEAIVTSDNPRTEDPLAIIGDILPGVPAGFPHRVEPDRTRAIRLALAAARPGDCVVVAGKGHETYQEVNGVRHHFDDSEVVREVFTQMGAAR